MKCLKQPSRECLSSKGRRLTVERDPQSCLLIKRWSSTQKQHEYGVLRARWIKNSILLGLVVVIICLLGVYAVKILIVEKPGIILGVKGIVTTYGLVGIFLMTILAGTIVPLGSPALVAAAAAFGLPKVPLIIVTAVGFTIGITINYYLAYFLGRPYVTKKVSQDKLDGIMRWWNKWGVGLYVIFGLIPILPVELLSLVCGLLKMRLDHFLSISFGTRLVQFAIFVYFGELVGSWIGL